MRRISTWLVIAGLLLVLTIANHDIMQHEAVIETGRTILLPLRPVDPRSLIQGDYMDLRYASETFPDPGTWETLPRRGAFVLRLDEHDVGAFARLDDGSPLARDEVRLRYRGFHRFGFGLGDPRIGAESFLFQEGRAEDFADARYGVLRVAEDGTSVLIGLADENHAVIAASR